MFERRLKVLLLLPCLFGAVILIRLFQLQILLGRHYRDVAEAALIAPTRYLPPLRGRILDRTGRPLVSDEPAHDATVHYGVLSLAEKPAESMNQSYPKRLADGIRRREPAEWRSADPADLHDEVRRRIDRMWDVLERVSGETSAELASRRADIRASVERMRRSVHQRRRRSGGNEELADVHLVEQGLFYPILRDVSPEVRTAIELELADLPFVRIEPAVRRRRHPGAEVLCHVLGRLGQVSPDQMARDPRGDDRLAAYRPGDSVGASGVERLAEEMLRGVRGYQERFLSGAVKDQRSSIDGLDVQLTIDVDLQRRVMEIVARAVEERPSSPGGSCVIIDVETRQILALVSVPIYDWKKSRDDYASLRDDARQQPLLFRAVQQQYPPGSTIKPVALLAGLSLGVIDPQATGTCDGGLFPKAEHWHCWTNWRGLPGHGPLTAVGAIQHSCNVYFYRLGQRVKAERLTDFYRKFLRGEVGDGPPPRGTGLIEERPGLIPTLAWMRRHHGRGFQVADGRNYAIGQGDVELTPLQVANMFATLAAGHYRDPILIANQADDRPAIEIPGLTQADCEVARRGLYQCVNEVGGTAYNWARIDELQICGKTGSAQSVPRVVRWRFFFKAGTGDEDGVVVTAPTLEAARERLGLPPGARPVRREVAETWPPKDPSKNDYPTHAWFGGFTPYRNPKIALAVMIEYGGAGGATAGSVGRAVFETLAKDPHGYLSPVPELMAAGTRR